MSEGLRALLIAEDELTDIFMNRMHWIILIPLDNSYLLDEVDDAIGHYPTFPTAPLFRGFRVKGAGDVPPCYATFIPKSQITVRKLKKALLKVTGTEPAIDNDHDIIGIMPKPAGMP